MNELMDLCVCDAENKLYENNLLINDRTVKFLADKCAVVEYYKNNKYLYYAININTLETKYLGLRKNELDMIYYSDLIKKVVKLEINKNDLTLKLTRYEREKELLSHIFKYILPQEGFALRENQVDLALEILDGLEHNCVSLMEAEVGTGKTHAYIMAVIIHNLFNNIKHTTIISTSTIALQRAITEEYIPQISKILKKYKILKKSISCIVRKGKSHYVCDLRLKSYYSSISHKNLKSDESLINILQKLKDANDSEIDLDLYQLSRYVKEKICVSKKCNNYCPQYKNCRFILFSNKCFENCFDFQIANHNFVFANALSQFSLLPDYKVLIFDEAHKLYDIAKQMYGCYLTEMEVPDLVSYIEASNALSIKGSCSVMRGYNTKIFNHLIKNAPENFISNAKGRVNAILDNICIGYIKALNNLLVYISKNIFSFDDIISFERKKHIKRVCENISKKLLKFSQLEQFIYWLENEGVTIKLCTIPKELDKMISMDFWDTNISHILTSGTLSVNGDFGLIKKKIGIDLISTQRVKEITKASPFDYKENAMIYIPEYIPFPNLKNSIYIQAIVDEIDRLLRITYGHALVLFTSYWLMEKVFSNLSANDYEYPLFIMGRGRIDALREFKISGNGVLFASDSAGEGVDIVGDTLSNLIIVKLPFSVPDPISEYEQHIVGGLNEYLDKINTPNMIIKLRQYVGRLIRCETDTGVVAILDSRVNSSGKYRGIVLNSLFDARVTNNIIHVENFILSKKDKFYFE